MDSNITPELLQRYAQGRCTPEEIAAIEQWLEQETDPFECVGNGSTSENEELRTELWNAVKPLRIGVSVGILWKVAASILLIATLAAAVYLNQPTISAEVIVSQKTITTPVGKTKLVRFPDGSTVLLQGGASLSYPDNFSAESRKITLLKGKALLDITHDPEHPFIANTGEANVEVLGTRFVVNNQPKSIQVTLARGKIRFSSNKTSQLMKPGQQLHYNKSRETIEQLVQVDTSYATAWTRQSLWFDNTPLSGVLNELSSVYGVQCTTGPKVDTKRLLNGRFDQLPLSQVLVLLENSTGYRFHQRDGVVYID